MLARVKEGRPIHQRDPLFVELFKNADRIEARHELTAGGVRVVETSTGRVRGQAVTGACGGGQRISREWHGGDDEEPSGSAALDTHYWEQALLTALPCDSFEVSCSPPSSEVRPASRGSAEPRTPAVSALSPLEQLGKSVFFDRRLSLRGNQSCASCHAPQAGWTGDLPS